MFAWKNHLSSITSLYILSLEWLAGDFTQPPGINFGMLGGKLQVKASFTENCLGLNSTSKKVHKMVTPLFSDDEDYSYKLFKMPPREWTSDFPYPSPMVVLVYLSPSPWFSRGQPGVLASIKPGFLLIWSSLNYCVSREAYQAIESLHCHLMGAILLRLFGVSSGFPQCLLFLSVCPKGSIVKF